MRVMGRSRTENYVSELLPDKREEELANGIKLLKEAMAEGKG